MLKSLHEEVPQWVVPAPPGPGHRSGTCGMVAGEVVAPSEMYSSFGGSHTASWTGSGSVFTSCFCVWRGEVKGSEEQCPSEWASTGKDPGPASTARKVPKVENEA